MRMVLAAALQVSKHLTERNSRKEEVIAVAHS